MGENHVARTPTEVYGVVALGAAVAYFVLQTLVIREQGPGSALATAIGRDIKGKASPLLYLTGIASSFVSSWLAIGFYVFVAAIWLVPDRRVEAQLRFTR